MIVQYCYNTTKNATFSVYFFFNKCWLSHISLQLKLNIFLPLMGTQAGIGGCHFPWRHLETRTLLIWYPGSQKRWMVLLWGNPRHGVGSQRNPPCSGTRGWEQLLNRPVETQPRFDETKCWWRSSLASAHWSSPWAYLAQSFLVNCFTSLT